MQKKVSILAVLVLGLCAVYAQESGEALAVDPSGDVHVYENFSVKKDVQVKGKVVSGQGYFSGDAYIGNLHMFTAEYYELIWDATAKLEIDKVIDLENNSSIPPEAKGVILKVIVMSEPGYYGSILFADRNGNFAENEYPHYLSNGITNYNNLHSGGTVFVPFYNGRKIKIRHAANSHPDGTTEIESYGGLIGWF